MKTSHSLNLTGQDELTVQGWHWLVSCRWWSACPARRQHQWKRGMSGGRCSGSRWRGSVGQLASPTDAPRWHSGSGEPCRSSSSCWSGCQHRRSTSWCPTCIFREVWDVTWRGGDVTCISKCFWVGWWSDAKLSLWPSSIIPVFCTTKHPVIPYDGSFWYPMWTFHTV